MFDYLDLFLFITSILSAYFGHRKGKQNLPEAATASAELLKLLEAAAADRKLTASELVAITKKAKEVKDKLAK